jgi:predicted membrane channel-forming protein YqfA (hemolysin III family)
MAGKLRGVVFFVFLIIGLYFINYSLNLIKLPEFFSGVDKWIILIGGLLLIVGGVNYWRLSKHY